MARAPKPASHPAPIHARDPRDVPPTRPPRRSLHERGNSFRWRHLRERSFVSEYRSAFPRPAAFIVLGPSARSSRFPRSPASARRRRSRRPRSCLSCPRSQSRHFRCLGSSGASPTAANSTTSAVSSPSPASSPATARAASSRPARSRSPGNPPTNWTTPSSATNCPHDAVGLPRRRLPVCYYLSDVAGGGPEGNVFEVYGDLEDGNYGTGSATAFG